MGEEIHNDPSACKNLKNDMEEDSQSDNSLVRSQRSPQYSQEEIKALIRLIEKYKSVILNKCTNTTNNHAKEAAWGKVCKELNKQGFKHKRNVDSVKNKWENLKKEARKVTKNVITAKNSEFNEVICQIISLINETDNSSLTEIPSSLLQDNNDDDDEDENKLLIDIKDNSKNWDDDNDRQSGDSGGDDNDSSLQSRSLNFSPHECRLLLKCVREEKKHIFSKENNSHAIAMKKNAWKRITNMFNKEGPQSRSTKVLRTKFANMKKLTTDKKKVAFNSCFMKSRHEKLEEDTKAKNIKQEPENEYKIDIEIENVYDGGIESDNLGEVYDGANKPNQYLPDPLCTVLNGDSGIDAGGHFSSYSQSENKEVTKLKLELLKYQLETAKLERDRIKEAIEAESMRRQSKAIETSMRMRTARLELIAAESKLPAAHPALQYTDREDLARQYIQDLEFNPHFEQ